MSDKLIKILTRLSVPAAVLRIVAIEKLLKDKGLLNDEEIESTMESLSEKLDEALAEEAAAAEAEANKISDVERKKLN